MKAWEAEVGEEQGAQRKPARSTWAATAVAQGARGSMPAWAEEAEEAVLRQPREAEEPGGSLTAAEGEGHRLAPWEGEEEAGPVRPRGWCRLQNGEEEGEPGHAQAEGEGRCAGRRKVEGRRTCVLSSRPWLPAIREEGEGARRWTSVAAAAWPAGWQTCRRREAREVR